MPANDIHIKIDGISGESTVAAHRDEIVVESWNWGVANPAPISTGGAGGSAGRATFSDFTFVHRVDRASPLLWKACATGQAIREATLTVSRAGAAAQDYLTVKFSELRVTLRRACGQRPRRAASDRIGELQLREGRLPVPAAESQRFPRRRGRVQVRPGAQPRSLGRAPTCGPPASARRTCATSPGIRALHRARPRSRGSATWRRSAARA